MHPWEPASSAGLLIHAAQFPVPEEQSGISVTYLFLYRAAGVIRVPSSNLLNITRRQRRTRGNCRAKAEPGSGASLLCCRTPAGTRGQLCGCPGTCSHRCARFARQQHLG